MDEERLRGLLCARTQFRHLCARRRKVARGDEAGDAPRHRLGGDLGVAKLLPDVASLA